MDQKRNVSFSVAKRGYVDWKYIEPIEEIFPKLSLAHHSGKIPVRCSDQPGIYLYGVVATKPLELALLQNSQQLRLQIEPYISNFVEKQAAFVSQFNPATLLSEGTGERPFLVSK